MDESGLAKINLHPADWRDPSDRERYLDALDPEVYAGDPLSFAVLATLPLRTRPRALLSTSMALSPGLRERLQERFGCPVVDLYSMNETGGFNSWLPLLRYRTGDHAALRFDGSVPVLVGLEGRPPVRFRTVAGEWINNIEVTHALQRFAIPQFTVCQQADGALHVRLCGVSHERERIREALVDLFGAGQRVSVEDVEAFDGKVVQYTSRLADACP
jgi:phenylacetate-CoA ligase